MSSARTLDVAGAISEGFNTTVFPAAMAPTSGSNARTVQIAQRRRKKERRRRRRSHKILQEAEIRSFLINRFPN
jgi:hypothetical protein